MPDIVLYDKTGQAVPYTGADSLTVDTTEEGKTAKFTYGDLLEGAEVDLDFSNGNQVVTAPDGYVLREATLKKPDTLIPENIAKDVAIAGILGTFIGKKKEPVHDSGSYIPNTTGAVTVEHGLCMPPDVIIVRTTLISSVGFSLIIGVCSELAERMGIDAQYGVLNGTNTLTFGSTAGIESPTTDDVGFIREGNPKNFYVGGTTLNHAVGETYQWEAVGGLLEHSGYFYAKLALDGNGNLIVSGGVPAIEQLEIYVDGVYAKTVDYVHGEEFIVDISDVANEFKAYTISVIATGESLEEDYPYRYYDPVTDWVVANFDDAIAYGDCGDNAKWKLTEDGTLHIGGTGAMYDYAGTSEQPWLNYVESITTVVITEGVTHIGNQSLRELALLSSVSIPDTVTSIGVSAFLSCTSLTSVEIPDSVTTLGNYVFYNCTSLESVSIGNGVTSIGDQAFQSCTKLTSVTIPDSVTIIGKYAFRNCTSLESVVIGNGVTTIELYAFHTCTALKSVTMGNSVQTINYRAFQACSALTSIVIPATVKLMGDNVFYGCSSLTSATFKATSTWRVYANSTTTSYSSVSSSSLSNPTTAATYLRSTYVSKWWKRT